MAKVRRKRDGGNAPGPASEKPTEEPSTRDDVVQPSAPDDPVRVLVAAAVACGMPEPGTGAYEVWLDDVLHRSNLPPRSDGAPGGHISGFAFDDDPDGTRARLALMLARRRWSERASYTGLEGARAVASLLRFVLVAMGVGVRDAQVSKDEHARRLEIVCKVGAIADEHLHDWIAPTARADVARHLLERARGQLRDWSSNQPRRFPNCPAIEERFNGEAGSHIASVLVGALASYEPHRTHGGATLAERNARADLVVRTIAQELNRRRAEFRDELVKAEAHDRGAYRTPQTTVHSDKARAHVARSIAVCAFAGLHIADGMEPDRARKHANDSKIGRKR